MSFLKAVRDHYGDPERPPATDPPALAAAPNHDDTPYGMKALASECEIVARAVEGTRDDTLNRAAFRMGRLIASGELTEQTARTNLAAAARQTGQPEHEIQRALRDGGALTAGRANPRYIPPRAALADPHRSQDGLAPAEVDDEAFWLARPELTHIRDFARARMAPPYGALGVTLARISAATDPQIVLPATVGSEASLNLYVALVAPSGGGKGISNGCAKDATRIDGVETFTAGSGEGLAHLYARRTKDGVERTRDSVLLDIPEIDTLAALGDRRGATLMPELRKAWSGERLGFAYADPAKALPIDEHTYRLALIAGVQPGRAQWLLDEAAGGTPQRFLWMPATDPQAPDIPPPCPNPRTWEPPADRPPVNGWTGRWVVPICDTAANLIRETRREQNRGNHDALDGHALLTRLKTAACLAILGGRYNVNDEDWELSAHLSEISERTRTGIVDALKREAAFRNTQKAEAEAARAIHISERQNDEGIKKTSKFVLRKIQAAPDGLTRSQLVEGLTRTRREYLDAALYALVQAGQIVVTEGRTRRWKPAP